MASIERCDRRITRYPYGARSAFLAQRARAPAPLPRMRSAISGSVPSRRRSESTRSQDRSVPSFTGATISDPGRLSDDTVYALHVDATATCGSAPPAAGSTAWLAAPPTRVGAFREPVRPRRTEPGGLRHRVRRDDRLWLSTNNGLARFDPRQHSIKWFHQVHGLQDEEFNFNAHYRASDGALYSSAATTGSMPSRPTCYAGSAGAARRAHHGGEAQRSAAATGLAKSKPSARNWPMTISS